MKLHGLSSHKLWHPATSDLEVTQRAKITALAATYFFGVQSIRWWQVRQFEKGNPVLWVIPQALRGSAASRQPGLKVSAYGYEFEVALERHRYGKDEDRRLRNCLLFPIRSIS